MAYALASFVLSSWQPFASLSSTLAVCWASAAIELRVGLLLLSSSASASAAIELREVAEDGAVGGAALGWSAFDRSETNRPLRPHAFAVRWKC